MLSNVNYWRNVSGKSKIKPIYIFKLTLNQERTSLHFSKSLGAPALFVDDSYTYLNKLIHEDLYEKKKIKIFW